MNAEERRDESSGCCRRIWWPGLHGKGEWFYVVMRRDHIGPDNESTCHTTERCRRRDDKRYGGESVKVTVTPAVVVVVAVVLSGCFGIVGVGSRVCAMHQAGCDFTDHVLRTFPSGTICPTWNVQFAQYNPTGQPTDTYAIQYGRDDIVATLNDASTNNLPVHVWYAGEQYVLYSKCSADYPLVIYDARLAA